MAQHSKHLEIFMGFIMDNIVAAAAEILAQNPFGNIPVPVNVYTHHGPYALRR